MITLPPPPPPPQPAYKRISSNWIFAILVASFLVAILITAYLVFSLVRSTVFSLRSEIKGPEIVEEPVFLTPNDIASLINIDTPLQSENGPPPEYWDGLSRVNVLFIGVDRREWVDGQGPPLADTLILATYDPQTQSVGMLSIPRDLWVDLPGLGFHKINQSFQMGEATHYPGGGAAMAIDTVENILDVPIHFYVLVDFEAFVSLVDEIGGVKIDVPEQIVIDPIGDNNTKILQPGIQTLPGDLALAYARSRNSSGSDFDRAERQQQVIMGVRKRVASFEVLPTLISRAPVLYKELSSRINTNLNVQQIFELAWDIQQIPEERIRRRVIGHEQVVLSVSYDGMSILLPIPEEILFVRDDVFSTEVQENRSTEVVTDAELIAAEVASISIRNGTMVAGLAARTDYFLQSEGITPLEITNADQLYTQTTIVDYTGKPHTRQYLSELLGAVPGNVYQRYDPASLYDIVVILGEDWAANNQMP